MKEERILDTMSVAEAIRFLPSSQQKQLQHWAETFGVALKDFHGGHFLTYEEERRQNASKEQTYAETTALLDLLNQQNLGTGIFLPSRFSEARLNQAEFDGLPVHIRRYIEHLQNQISSLRSESDRQKSQIRRTNWGRSR